MGGLELTMTDVTGSPGQGRGRGAGRGVGRGAGECLRKQSKLLLAPTQEAAHQVLSSRQCGVMGRTRAAGQARPAKAGMRHHVPLMPPHAPLRHGSGRGHGTGQGEAKARRAVV